MNRVSRSGRRKRLALSSLGAVVLLVSFLTGGCGSVGRTAGTPDIAARPLGLAPEVSASGERRDRPAGGEGDLLPADGAFAAFPPISAADRLRVGDGFRDAAVYTYVLFGIGDQRQPQEARPWRHVELELLRLIDTYVVSEPGARAASGHVFLVPVYAGLDSLPLTEQTAPELADRARLGLAAALGASGHARLANRLRGGAGPFLVSRTRAGLLPVAPQDRLLLTDLSETGPEYLYPVIDAYDRPVTDRGRDPNANLYHLQERLARLEATSASASGAAGQGRAAQWVFLVEGRGTSQLSGSAPVRGG